MRKINKLKLCPFCKSKSKLLATEGDDRIIICSNCGLSILDDMTWGDDYDADENVVKKWNTRPLENELNLEIKQLKKSKKSKVIYNGKGFYFCDSCKGTIWQIRYESKYCFRCGSKLDWADINYTIRGKK